MYFLLQQLDAKDMEEKLQAHLSNRAHVCRLVEEKTREITGLGAKGKDIEGIKAAKRRRDNGVYSYVVLARYSHLCYT